MFISVYILLVRKVFLHLLSSNQDQPLSFRSSWIYVLKKKRGKEVKKVRPECLPTYSSIQMKCLLNKLHYNFVFFLGQSSS